MMIILKSSRFRSRNSAPAAPSPGPAAAAATPASAAPAATPGAATAATASTASANDNGDLLRTGDIFLIEQMERGETDVGHLFLAKDEALLGRAVVGLRDIGSRHRRRGCASRQGKPQSGSAQRGRGGGFGLAVPSRSLLHSWHGRFLRYVVRFRWTWLVWPYRLRMRGGPSGSYLAKGFFSQTRGSPQSAPRLSLRVRRLRNASRVSALCVTHGFAFARARPRERGRHEV